MKENRHSADRTTGAHPLTPPCRLTRRRFLVAGAASGALLGMPLTAATPSPAAAEGLVSVSSGNGLRSTAQAVSLMQSGTDTLDAAIAGVNIVEEDPNDMSVGYGGLPNEDGVVQLDSCVMHGPSYNAGAVAALENIKTPSRVARLVLSRTDHVLIVGAGAYRFARAHGFKSEELLTDKARKAWLKWKESHSDRDDWLTPEEEKTGLGARQTGTITCLCRNARGDLSGVTTTSGLAFKIPGRVGDSPIIGAGLYVDNDVGAAGATGRGEAVIISGGSRVVVENMRHGMTPAEAVRDALQRLVRQTVDPRLLDADGRPDYNVAYYALNKKGEFASGCLWGGPKFAVNASGDNRLETCFSLFQKA